MLLGERILANLPYEPNAQQMMLIAALSRFCAGETGGETGVFLLNGYAGTGKTSLTAGLVKALRELGVKVVLLAPTGRAAKVFSSFAGYPASTIHRRIYSPDPTLGGEGGFGPVCVNPLRDAVFIVDEASMIGDEPSGSSGGTLLSDLTEYVYSSPGCRMILLGDTAQLPPVGASESPAMMPEKLKGMGLKVSRAVITETVRQARKSGILYNATWLRKAMRIDPLPEPKLTVEGFRDVRLVSGEELPDELARSYAEVGEEQTIMVTRSNARAVKYNMAIRGQILMREEELCVGERLIVAKNNYLWSAKVEGLDFIANGDIITVSRIYGAEQRYGMRFADIEAVFDDRPVSVRCKIVLSSLTSPSHALTVEEINSLAEGVLADAPHISPEASLRQKMRYLKSDPYFGALQVKYAYVVTCHKAQGGQWEHVYVDMAGIPPEQQQLDFYRWLYTATTRATKKIWYVK